MDQPISQTSLLYRYLKRLVRHRLSGAQRRSRGKVTCSLWRTVSIWHLAHTSTEDRAPHAGRVCKGLERRETSEQNWVSDRNVSSCGMLMSLVLSCRYCLRGAQLSCILVGTGLVDVAVVAHPALLNKDDFEKVKVPISLICPEGLFCHFWTLTHALIYIVLQRTSLSLRVFRRWWKMSSPLWQTESPLSIQDIQGTTHGDKNWCLLEHHSLTWF